MYERSYGYRYAEVQDMSAQQIAKVIRGDIKQAVDEGLLPARWTYSVRSDHNSISVEVLDCADAWKPCDGLNCHNVWCAARNDPVYAHAAEHHERLTAEAESARVTLDRIHSAYNHDGSEIQTDYFDVRYYGHVSFEDASSADFRRREAVRLAAKKQARESGTVVGRVAKYSRDARSATIHLLVEQADGKKVLGCGARVMRYSVLGRVADDKALTCSRCAKRAQGA